MTSETKLKMWTTKLNFVDVIEFRRRNSITSTKLNFVYTKLNFVYTKLNFVHEIEFRTRN